MQSWQNQFFITHPVYSLVASAIFHNESCGLNRDTKGSLHLLSLQNRGSLHEKLPSPSLPPLCPSYCILNCACMCMCLFLSYGIILSMNHPIAWLCPGTQASKQAKKNKIGEKEGEERWAINLLTKPKAKAFAAIDSPSLTKLWVHMNWFYPATSHQAVCMYVCVCVCICLDFH